MRKEKNIKLWNSDLGNGYYHNPILYTDYSDPDIIRVEDTFYLTASSFNFIPGLPILISKDLVNWKLVNYAVSNLPFKVYDLPAHGKGIWAPSIRYYDNYFWIFVGMPDEGIFMTKTKDPLKEWEPLCCIWKGKGFIDPCPFWDETGNVYLIHAYAKSRIGFKSKLGLMELSKDGTRCITEDKFIFDGTKTQPTIEGPKVYKRNGFYYIFAPAGGVKNGWQTVLRSKNINGPFEEKVVMHQGNTNINGPHQGGLVRTKDNKEFFVHFQDKDVYGRIVHLQPVIWKDNWPIIGVENKKKGIGEPVLKYKKPVNIVKDNDMKLVLDDDFKSEKLGLQWQWMSNYKDEFYSLKNKKNQLCLFAQPIDNKKNLLNEYPNILTQKIVGPSFIAETKIDYSDLMIKDSCGMIIIGGNYASLYVEKKEDGNFFLCYCESYNSEDLIKENIVIKENLNKNKKNLYIRLEFFENRKSRFLYSIDSINWSKPTLEFENKKGIWVGARIGIYNITSNIESKGKAYFDYFYVM